MAILSGDHREIARAHGELLGEEAETGPISESLEHVDYGISKQSVLLRPAIVGIVQCLTAKLYGSLTAEFRRSVDGYFEGYIARMRALGRAPKFTKKNLEFASVGIEFANVLDAMNESNSVLGSALLHCPIQTAFGASIGLVVGGVFGGASALAGGQSPFKLGCTGFAVPSRNQDGRTLSAIGHVHARNLDGELMRSWNRAPTIFLVRERGRLAYLASGSAGLIYPAGISGINETGLAVSLHQMYSAETQISAPPESTAIAPFLQEMILREASSVQEAIEVAGRLRSIASWTIFVSDAKTGEAASIELTKEGRLVSRWTRGEPIGQTNHFFSPEQARFAYFPNAFKRQETQTRLLTLNRRFARLSDDLRAGRRPWTLQDSFDQLSSHEDVYGRFQALGTTATKAYGVMSVAMLPGRRQLWMTVGDFSPAPHATYLGIEATTDWRATVFAGVGRSRALERAPRLRQSLEAYALARLAYERGDLRHATEQLDRAIELARLDGTVEPQYLYIKARLLAERGFARAAAEAFNRFLSQPLAPDDRRALAMMFRAAIEPLPLETQELNDLAWARSIMEKELERSNLKETRLNIQAIDRLLSGRRIPHQPIDWVVFR